MQFKLKISKYQSCFVKYYNLIYKHGRQNDVRIVFRQINREMKGGWSLMQEEMRSEILEDVKRINKKVNSKKKGTKVIRMKGKQNYYNWLILW